MATYISKQSGLWSSATTWLTAAAGTFTPTADAGAPPQSGGGDKIIIRGADTVVEYDVNGVFGDGTVSPIAPTSISTDVQVLSNAICLSGGKLKASRTISTSLTANGTISINNRDGAWFDWGTSSDPISANGVTAELVQGVAAIATRFGISVRSTQSPDNGVEYSSVTFCGKHKTRNTQLDGPHSTGTNTLSVLDCTNWEVGDIVVLEPPYVPAPATPNILATITNINGNVVTISNTLNANFPSGVYVGNFSSNVTIRPGIDSISGGSSNGYGVFINTNGNSSLYEFKNCSFTNFHGVYGGGGIIYVAATYARRSVLIDSVSFYSPRNVFGTILSLGGGVSFPTTINNIASYGIQGVARGVGLGSGSSANVSNSCIYRTAYGFDSRGCFDLNINNLRTFTTNSLFGDALQAARINILDSYFRINGNASNFRLGPGIFDKVTVRNTYLESVNGPLVAISESSTGLMDFINCTTVLSPSLITVGTLKTSKQFVLNAYSLQENPLSNSRNNSWVALSGNYSVRNRGLASYQFNSRIANQSFYISEKIPAKANISQRYIGYLKYDSIYGDQNLPYVTFTDDFGNPAVTQEFNCDPLPDQWQKFDLTVTPVNDGDITMTVFGQTSSITANIYLDGLTFDPINPGSRHYGFIFDPFTYKTVDTLTTLTENQVSAISVVNNLDYLYDVSNYWSVTNPSLSTYVDLHTRDGNILDLGSKNIVIDNSVSEALSYVEASSTLTIKTPLLSSGSNFIGLRTTGNIYLSSGSTIGEIDIYGNVFQATPVSLSGIYMEGTLAYNTNSNTTIEYTDCTMDTVQNDGSGIVTVKKTNSTIANGSDAEIVDFIPTILNVTLNGGYLAIYDDTGTRQYYQNTDGTIVLPSNATGTWTYKISRYGYQFIQGSFVVDGNTGATIEIAPSYTPDNFVTSDPATVAAYTDLNTSEKIYNYLNYWTTTTSGIDYVPFYGKAFGSITINKNVTLDATSGSILTYNGSTLLTLKCSGLSEDILFVSNGNIIAQNGTTYSDDVKIRATNINSELILGGVTSLTLFPTENDRNNNTNEGDTLTGTIYRFLYGDVVSGVTLSGTIYAKVDVAGTILLYSDAITTGRNELEFGTTGTLQQIINNQKVINQGIQKASILVPHTTNI
jgi:hypothetical protein